MERYAFVGNLEKGTDVFMCNLLLFNFQDENDVHFIYSPHLDLTGYGHNDEDAKSSFTIVFEDFMHYTINKGTLLDILKELGWEVQSEKKKINNMVAPKFSEFKKKDYVSEIFDNYPPVTAYRQEVHLPNFA